LKSNIKKKPNKSPDSATSATPREVQQKRQVIQKKLDQIKEYKRLLAEEGLVPDASDKERESRLIQQLLGLDKDQSRRDAQARRGRPSAQSSRKGQLPPPASHKKSSRGLAPKKMGP
jgi:hypothetical protein